MIIDLDGIRPCIVIDYRTNMEQFHKSPPPPITDQTWRVHARVSVNSHNPASFYLPTFTAINQDSSP